MSDEVTGKAEPQTRLAFRSWELDRAAMMVRSVTDVGRGGRSATAGNWIAKAMAAPLGNWPHDRPLAATCSLPAPKPRRKKKGDETDQEPEHGPAPAKDCRCGIYATTDLDVINMCLTRSAPILGVVELGGRLIPASMGYRAAYARVAAILLVDEALTEPHGLLREIAAAYQVPALVPHDIDPEQYREAVGLPTVAGEAEAWLRRISGPPPA